MITRFVVDVDPDRVGAGPEACHRAHLAADQVDELAPTDLVGGLHPSKR
jgi:hypothetical protein